MTSGLWLLAITRAFAGNFYAGISPANVPWPGGVVPYEFTNTLTAAEQQTYLDGLREWELAANVQFVPRTTQTRWILFTYNTNGFDNVSSSTNPQVVSVASLSRAQVCHEMGHSFGFTHENIRSDATNYIAVLTNNIADEPTNIYWFTVDPTTVTNGPYDFESVMHLGWDFDSTNRGVLATQQPKPPYFPRYEFRLGNYCLSPGDRAALAYLYGPPAAPLTNVVSTTADVGPGSLRAAIYYATDHPGTTIRFDIPTSDPGYSNGVFNIHLTGMLPPLVANGTVVDGSTQPGFTDQPVIFVDGSQILHETFTADTFLIYSANNQIKGLSFSGFNWNGLTLEYADATNNTVSGCWFGLDDTGTNAAPNADQGILIAAGASGNLIGGTNALERNVISGNSQYGVFISDSDTTGNRIFGNYIGTDFTGSGAAPNGRSGVFIGNGSSGNSVGLTALVRNIISGNSECGIYLTDSNTTANRISGNYIGTDFSGSNAVANFKSGVFIGNGAGGTYIGGTAGPVTQNVISGNAEYGVDLENTVSNVILGNYIGLDAGGSASLGNTLAGVGILAGAQNNLIGGSGLGVRNVISGNAQYGILLNGAVSNSIQGNFIGPDSSGSAAPANDNTYGGIGVWGGAADNLFGGVTPGARNLISGNNSYGIFLEDPGTSGNVLEDNFIGTDLTGTNALGNWFAGVALWNGATGNLIGAPVFNAGNTIAFNGWAGVDVYEAPTTNNSIRGNSIFSNHLGIDLGGDGVTTNHSGVLAGPNDLQNFPVLTNAVGGSFDTIVRGSLSSLPNRDYFLDFYSSRAADLSGYGEGEFYLGSITVMTDASGNAGFSFTNAFFDEAGQYLTATATSAGGDSSEFGPAVLATNLPVASAQFIGPYQPRTNGFAFSLTLQTNFSYRIQAATNLAPPVIWTDLTNFTATNSPFSFTDHSATNYRVRFYRVVSP